jgi:branched-chain amino acid transport system ATP-binding protein
MSELMDLEVSELSVNYGNVKALKNISFKVPQGKIISLIGANGAGKTTTLKALSGLVEKKGMIFLKGKRVDRLPSHIIVQRGLVHCPEGRGIFPNLTVMENLLLGTCGSDQAKANFSSNLQKSFEFFPRLQERVKQLAGTLSGGEQQMLAIARALAGEPKVLLLDEPSLGLAPQMVKLIFDIIVRINHEKNVTVLLVEQNAKQALKISHFAYVLEAGLISLFGSGEELLGNDQVRKIYLGEH